MKKIIRLFIILLILLATIILLNVVQEKLHISKFSELQTHIQSLDSVVKLDISNLGDIIADSMYSNEEYAVITYWEYPAEEEYTEEVVEKHYYIALYDMSNKQFISKKEYENPEEGNFRIAVNKDNFELYSNHVHKRVVFDYELNKIEETTYTAKENYEKVEEIESINISYFECKDNYVKSIGNTPLEAIMFYDTPDKFYIVKPNPTYQYNSSLNHKILLYDKPVNKNTYTLKLLDFDNQTILNTLELQNVEELNVFEDFDENNIFFARVTYTGKVKELCIWNYNKKDQAIPFEKGFCEELKVADIQNKVDNIVSYVKEEYNIDFKYGLTEDFFEIFGYNVTSIPGNIMLYLNMIKCKEHLAYLPKKLYEELLCKDIENPIEKFDGISICIVDDIDDIADAFVCSKLDEENNTNILYIVYSFTGCDTQTFFHEFFHAMDYRIENYTDTFNKEWQDLNPEGFEYTSDYISTYYNNEEWMEYFTRDYAMKGASEDMAECFAVLNDEIVNNTTWWRDKPHIVKKVELLIQAIELSFESLKEKY